MFTRGPPKSATEQRNPAGTPDGNGKWQELVNESDEKRRAFKNQLEKTTSKVSEYAHIKHIYI